MKKSLLVLLICLLISCGNGVDQTVTIESLGNQMAYNVTSIDAKVGETINIVFVNKATVDVMKHNVVVISDKQFIDEIGIAALSEPDYLPDHKAIIAATELSGPGETVSVTFTLPNKPGQYPYICTYPGHYSVMQGVINVTE